MTDYARVLQFAGWLMHGGALNDRSYPGISCRLVRYILCICACTGLVETGIGVYQYTVPGKLKPPGTFFSPNVLAAYANALGAVHYHWAQALGSEAQNGKSDHEEIRNCSERCKHRSETSLETALLDAAWCDLRAAISQS